LSYKNIRIPKRGGGTRLQRVEVLKSGKYKFVKNVPSKSKKNIKTKQKTRSKRKVGKRKFSIPIAPVLGIAAGMTGIPSGYVRSPAEYIMRGDIEGTLNTMKSNYLGLSKKGDFDLKRLAVGVGPMIIGLLVHKFVGGEPFNLNRMLATAGVPVVRI